jgi:Mitochondrial ribosomal protein mL59
LINGPNPNPFLPWRNPETSRWRAPKYSLRRQADLVKLAKKHGVEPLLPPSRKSTAFKEARLLEHGLRVRGTGEGQKVKGHIWERRMPAKLEKRRKAMEGMPEMVRTWKQVSLMLFLLWNGVCMLIMPYRRAMDEDGRDGPDNDVSTGFNVSVYHPIITIFPCFLAAILQHLDPFDPLPPVKITPGKTILAPPSSTPSYSLVLYGNQQCALIST